MEWIDNHPLWDVLRWPIWIATLIVVAYFMAKVFYRFCMFLRGCVMAFITPPVAFYYGVERWRVFARLLLSETLDSNVDSSSMFRSGTMMNVLLYERPEVLRDWARENPVHFAQLVLDDPSEFEFIYVECGECGGTDVSIRPGANLPEGC